MTRSVLEMIQLRIEEYQEKLDHPIHVEGSRINEHEERIRISGVLDGLRLAETLTREYWREGGVKQ
jgi:hypothetical protein